MARSYDQFCALALALERVGERWTALILRDLAPGPKRYTDLLSSLSGIGSSVLSERLRRLEDDGFIRRREVPPPTPAVTYELTIAGRELFEALLPLAAWGMRYLADVIPSPTDQVRPEWVLAALEATFDPSQAKDVDDLYEFQVADDTFWIGVDDGAMRTGTSKSPRAPDVVIRCDWPTLFAVGFGRLPREEAITQGLLASEGSQQAVERCYRLFGPSRATKQQAQ